MCKRNIALLLLTAGLAAAAKMLPLKSIAGIAVISVISLIFLGLCIYSNVITGQLFSRIDEKQQQLADMEAWKYKHLDELSLLIQRRSTRVPLSSLDIDVHLVHARARARATHQHIQPNRGKLI